MTLTEGMIKGRRRVECALVLRCGTHSRFGNLIGTAKYGATTLLKKPHTTRRYENIHSYQKKPLQRQKNGVTATSSRFLCLIRKPLQNTVEIAVR